MTAARDTIFALSSGRPPAAIAVVRMSGPRAGAALEALTGRLPAPRRAALARVRRADSDEVIDEALALWFPGPNSETGEDVAELQLHGGRAVVAAVLVELARIDGLRAAEAGEFTRRAFENGRLDLTAVEGLADLIYAETEAQRRQAYRQLKGVLGDRAEAWRARLTEALALVEARIDFSDEADVPEDLIGPALDSAALLRSEIAEALAGAARGERLRDGLVVAIAGPPNVGKSTLLNRIARREVAIVSPIPGTTRDVIEVHLDLGGYPVTLLDTAGIRESDDPVEQEGVRRARKRASEADLVLWLQDARDLGGESSAAVPGAAPADAGARWPDAPLAESVSPGATAPRRHRLPLSQAFRPDAADGVASRDHSLGETPIWTVFSKADLKSMDEIDELRLGMKESNIIFIISSVTGNGLDRLLQALTRHAAQYLGGEPALVTRFRQRQALETALQALDRALAEGRDGREDIIAEELRVAANALARLTGRIDVEDVLDVIFRDFCIGK